VSRGWLSSAYLLRLEGHQVASTRDMWETFLSSEFSDVSDD
jgi:hypothetical protein